MTRSCESLGKQKQLSSSMPNSWLILPLSLFALAVITPAVRVASTKWVDLVVLAVPWNWWAWTRRSCRSTTTTLCPRISSDRPVRSWWVCSRQRARPSASRSSASRRFCQLWEYQVIIRRRAASASSTACPPPAPWSPPWTMSTWSSSRWSRRANRPPWASPVAWTRWSAARSRSSLLPNRQRVCPCAALRSEGASAWRRATPTAPPPHHQRPQRLPGIASSARNRQHRPTARPSRANAIAAPPLRRRTAPHPAHSARSRLATPLHWGSACPWTTPRSCPPWPAPRTATSPS